MSFFPDMGVRTLIDEGEHIRAIGWLSSRNAFPQGEAPSDFVERLREFVRLWWPSTEALGWGLFMGGHRCEICRGFGAGGNFGVPDGPLLFVAPEMVGHYVEAHQYLPPAVFITAVRHSPLPGTEEYRAAIEPFRLKHLEYQERCDRQTIATAARWALEHGADDQAVRDAGSRFLCNGSPEMLERIRRAMQTAEQVAKAADEGR